jgi:hypothetical protein
MAITTLNGVISGRKPPQYYAKGTSGTMITGRPWTPFYVAGIPGAAVAPTPGVAGAALTTYAGQIPVPAAVGGQTIYLDRFSGVSSAQAGLLLLCDRLWHNSGIVVTTTTAQTINSVVWPARDVNGATNGDGVYIGFEVSSATGAGASVISINYTNSAGTAGRTGAAIDAYLASSVAGSFYRLGLAAGDVGVRSIQSFTSTVSMTSGVVHLVAYRVLATLELAAANLPNALDAVTGSLPVAFDGTVPFFIYLPSATAQTQLTGTVTFAQG